MTRRTRMPRCFLLLAYALALSTAACEDPARPQPDFGSGAVLVDSEPQGASISIDGQPTGEVTPTLLDDLPAGVRAVLIELDTGGFTYSYHELIEIQPDSTPTVSAPLTIRCGDAACLRETAEFHTAGNIRFAINAAGPLFIYDRVDAGIVWPSNTPNSYSPLGAATIVGQVGTERGALGLRNAGTNTNYWAGRPVTERLDTDPYHVRIPAWIVPEFPSAATLRGIEITQEIVADPDLPNALEIVVTWRNISADSLYRLLDPAAPEEGVTYSHVFFGFILDADIGAIGESDDDLVSYSVEHNMVFAYDSDFEVSGFSAGWSDEPGLLGLLVLDAPSSDVRLNAWPRSLDFTAGATDQAGYALVIAGQTLPLNHPHGSIGYAPDDETDDYILSAAIGPFDFAPADSMSARFAIVLAPPVAGTFESGTLLPAGDPVDGSRPLAATAARLMAVADSVIGLPLPTVPPRAE